MSSDSNLVKRAVIKTAGSLATSIPGLAQAWALGEALLGNSIEIRQQRAVEWVELIQADSSTFSKKLLETEEFQDGFVLGLENYIRTRSKDKREIAKAIFCGFAKAEAKEDFQIERFNDTLQKISGKALWLLRFLHETIEPMKYEAIIKEVEAMDLEQSDKPYEWWVEQKLTAEPFSKYLGEWVYERFNPNSEKLKAKYSVDGEIPKDKLAELFDTERVQRNKYYDPLSELEFLGIVGKQITTGWDAGGTEYRFTSYAKDFIKFISP